MIEQCKFRVYKEFCKEKVTIYQPVKKFPFSRRFIGRAQRVQHYVGANRGKKVSRLSLNTLHLEKIFHKNLREKNYFVSCRSEYH